MDNGVAAPVAEHRAGERVARYRVARCHSLVDFTLHIPANAMIPAWIAGIAAVPLHAGWARPSKSTIRIARVAGYPASRRFRPW